MPGTQSWMPAFAGMTSGESGFSAVGVEFRCYRSCRTRGGVVIVRPGSPDRPDIWEMSVRRARAIGNCAARAGGASRYFPCRDQRLKFKTRKYGRHHASSRPVEGHTPADDPLAGTRRHAAAAVHPERESHVARPDMDHRVGGPGAWLSGLRYAVRDRRQQQAAAADVRGARRLGRRVHLDVHVARRARLPRRRKGPGEGLRDVAEALGLAQFVRPAIDQGGE